jgi:hypothetical protein
MRDLKSTEVSEMKVTRDIFEPKRDDANDFGQCFINRG